MQRSGKLKLTLHGFSRFSLDHWAVPCESLWSQPLVTIAAARQRLIIKAWLAGGSTLAGVPLGNSVGSLLNATGGLLQPQNGGLLNISGALGGEMQLHSLHLIGPHRF